VGTTIPTGWPALDAALPGGGWPLGTLVELLLPRHGIGELQLLLPVLRALDAAERRWIVWVAPPLAPYPLALGQAGVAPSCLLIVEAEATQDRLWALEQSLHSRSCNAVLAWLDAADDRWLRRLKLAAEPGRALAVLFRPIGRREQSSPAALRLALEPLPDGLDVRVLKSRGGRPQRIRDVLGRGGRGSSGT
jgi:cell division inhibitor SulA/protein ImuA